MKLDRSTFDEDLKESAGAAGLPEALEASSRMVMVGATIGGFAIFCILERCLHRTTDRIAITGSPHVLLVPLSLPCPRMPWSMDGMLR